MGSNENLVHLVERINDINLQKEEVDEDIKIMLTVALLRTLLSHSGREVNEGVLFTLFNGIGLSFFKNNVEFKFENNNLVLLGDKGNRLYKFYMIDDVLLGRVNTRNSKGTFKVFYDTFDGLLYRDEKSDSEICSSFDMDGIESARVVDLKRGIDPYLDAGFEVKFSETRKGGFINIDKVFQPTALFQNFMSEYKESYSMINLPDKLTDFVRLPEINKGIGCDYSFGWGTHSYFKRLSLYDVAISESEYSIQDYISSLQDCISSEENSVLEKYFPKLAKVAKERLLQMIDNGLPLEIDEFRSSGNGRK